jgi:hypothetical protein
MDLTGMTGRIVHTHMFATATATIHTEHEQSYLHVLETTT